MADIDYQYILGLATTLFGRRDIYTTTEQITAENVVYEVNAALAAHGMNMIEEEYLYWYRRGIQPILVKKKDVRPEINNCVVENHAEEICTFKSGYFLADSVGYVARSSGKQNKVNKLNEYLYRSGKHDADNATVNWFHTVGKGVVYIEPGEDDEVPFRCYALDPRSAFVVYNMRPGNAPVMGVNMVVADEKVYFDVFTKDTYYKLSGTVVGKLMLDQKIAATAVMLEETRPNVLKQIPIVEYRYNSVNMGAFESVIPILDCMNRVTSDQMDGLDQFIQSLAIAVNCEFDEGTTANDIRRAGMLVLKSVGENRADFKIIAEQLNQSETQVFKDYLYAQMARICALPITDRNGRTYDSTGAAALVTAGWYQAESAARNCEDLFKTSNRYIDAIILDILKRKNLLDLSISDIELCFSRNEQSNAQSKALAAQTMLAMGMAPQLAFAKSGISNDPIADVKMSDKYLKLIWGDPDAPLMENDQPSPPDVAGRIPPNDNSPDEFGGGVSGPKKPADSRGQKEAQNSHQGQTWIEGYWQTRS